MAETTQWEYKILGTGQYQGNDKYFETDLTKLGAEGWEATGTMTASTGYGRVILKRPKQKQVSKDYDYGYSR